MLKRAGTPVNWTPELIEEYARCANDPIYFCKYLKVVTVDDGLADFIPHGYQEDLINSIINNRNTIACTARQAGKTTSVVAAIIHYILFNQDKRVAILANKADSAREVIHKLRIAYQNIPLWLQQGVVEWNKGSISLENGSDVIAAASSSDNIRGKAVALLYVDEAAHVPHWDEFFASVFPTISSGKETKIVLTSTPKGLNHFYRLWEDANAVPKRNEYHPIFVPWHAVPGRDEAWKKHILSSMGNDMQKFAQEQEGEFIGSSGTLIDGAKLKALVPRHYVNQSMGLYQYEYPKSNRPYVIVADVSHGKGLDYSAAHVIDVGDMPYRQVAVFHANDVLPFDYAGVLYRTAKMYNDAAVLVEANEIGFHVVETLHWEYEYENLVATSSDSKQGKRTSGGFGRGSERGVRTNKQVKLSGCSLIKVLIENDQLIINDKATINEFCTFSKKNQSFEAEEGCHDDLVMGLVLFGWLTGQSYFKEMTDINTLARLRNSTEKDIEENLLPFGFIVDGREEDEPPPGF